MKHLTDLLLKFADGYRLLHHAQSRVHRRPYVKAAANREAPAATGRSRGAEEFWFVNISAVLRDIGLPYLLGYQPSGNYQGALRDAIERFLTRPLEIARLQPEITAGAEPSGRLDK